MKLYVMRDFDLGQIAVTTILEYGEEFRWASSGREPVCFPHLPALNEPSEYRHYHETVAEREGGRLTLIFSSQSVTDECYREGDPQIIYRWSAFEAGLIATSIQIVYPNVTPDVKDIELGLPNYGDSALSLWHQGNFDNFGRVQYHYQGIRSDTNELLARSCTTSHVGLRWLQIDSDRRIEVRLLKP
jgi:hypothetical protein